MKPSAKVHAILVLTIALLTALPLAAGATEPTPPAPAPTPAVATASEASVPLLEPAGQCAPALALPAELADDSFLAPEPTAPPLCFVQYCKDVGVRCIGNGTGPHGCCRYSCSADPTCAGPDPCPPNTCHC